MIELFVAALLLRQEQVSAPPAAAPADELVGLWSARRWYGPYARGELVLGKTPGGWFADFMGDLYPVRAEGAQLLFDLPDGQGSFRGRMPQGAGDITGHWTPPNSRVHGFKYAAPALLKSVAPDRWRGNVELREDTFTLYLMVQRRPDGTLGAFLRNPERNIGVFYDVDHLIRDGDVVQLIGKRMGQKQEEVLFRGTYNAESGVLAVAFPDRGGTYDFRRDDDQSDFYPRGKNPGRYGICRRSRATTVGPPARSRKPASIATGSRSSSR